jgi:hypothetical protein
MARSSPLQPLLRTKRGPNTGPGYGGGELIRRNETGKALTFQDTYTYGEVYLDGNRVDVKAKKELTEFLLQWLTNFIDQGHKLVPVVKGDAKPLDFGG